MTGEFCVCTVVFTRLCVFVKTHRPCEPKSIHLITREYPNYKEERSGHLSSIYAIPEGVTTKETQSRSVGVGAGREEGLPPKGREAALGGHGKRLLLVVSEVMRLHTSVKIPGPLCLKWVNLTVYLLYLNAPAFKYIFMPRIAQTACLTNCAALTGTQACVFLKAVI